MRPWNRRTREPVCFLMQTKYPARRSKARPDTGSGSLILILLFALLLSAGAAGYYLMDTHMLWRMPAQTDHITLNFKR